MNDKETPIRMVFDPKNGTPIRDGDCDDLVRHMIVMQQLKPFGCRDDYIFGTENIFLAMRVAIRKGLIEHNKVFFHYDGHEIPIAGPSSAAPMFYPPGFLDYFDSWLEQLL